MKKALMLVLKFHFGLLTIVFYLSMLAISGQSFFEARKYKALYEAKVRLDKQHLPERSVAEMVALKTTHECKCPPVPECAETSI